ncbi:MAG: hypothetical protein ACFFB5_14570 [Promethearchaeota archaeon]
MLVFLHPIIQSCSRTSINGYRIVGPTSETYADSIEGVNPLLGIISSLIFIIGLLILIESIFFWVPSLTDLFIDNSKGKMIWYWTRLGFPERVFSLIDTDVRIIVRRKRFSLKGLFMREFTMEIHFTKDTSEVKRISDFTGIAKIIQKTPSHIILLKTVMLKSLPLQILQIKTLLASSAKIRAKTGSIL